MEKRGKKRDKRGERRKIVAISEDEKEPLEHIFSSFPPTFFPNFSSFLPWQPFFTLAGLEYPFLFSTHHRKERERERDK